jgi:uncharacterized protein YndB with AHSA1/START domain
MSETSTSAELATTVIKTIHVRTSVERAYRVFTEEIGTWWPRTHHPGDSPMKNVIVEKHVGGEVFTEQENGTNAAWGTVTAWEPPKHFAFAWRLATDWTYESDLAKCSEVDVTFAPEGDGTLVTLEHRHIDRHGDGWVEMAASVGSEGGWTLVLASYGETAEKAA